MNPISLEEFIKAAKICEDYFDYEENEKNAKLRGQKRIIKERDKTIFESLNTLNPRTDSTRKIRMGLCEKYKITTVYLSKILKREYNKRIVI